MWAKSLLSIQLLQPDMPVLDLCCNDNVHEVIDLWTQDWPRPAQVIVTADTMQRSEALLACWEQRGRPAHIVPVQFDPQGGIWGTLQRCAHARNGAPGFQAICCFNGLGHFFASPDSSQLFTQIVAEHLCPGGLLMGLATDSTEIWSKVVNDKREFVNREVKRDLFKFSVAGTHFGLYGTVLKGWLRADEAGATPRQLANETLCHFPSMINTCSQWGLEMVDIINLVSLWEMHRKHPASMSVLTTLLQQGVTKLSGGQADLLGVFTTILFRKNDGRMQ